MLSFQDDTLIKSIASTWKLLELSNIKNIFTNHINLTFKYLEDTGGESKSSALDESADG